VSRGRWCVLDQKHHQECDCARRRDQNRKRLLGEPGDDTDGQPDNDNDDGNAGGERGSGQVDDPPHDVGEWLRTRCPRAF